MSAAPAVINPQTVAVVGQRWDGLSSVRQTGDKRPFSSRFVSVDASSSGDEVTMKVRKPYTITKQRERWTESEHQKFLEALKLYGRAWRRIEEYIGTKTAVQIRSHAQKFFSKLEREATMGSSSGKVHDIEIPPPRPKRKPSHPYPKKAGNSTLSMGDQNKDSSPLPSVCTAVHQDLAQPSSFLPFNGKGGYRPGAAVPFHQGLSGRLGHLFRPQGSMKLFGKTVLVPKTLKPASQNVLAKESFALEGFPCIKTWPPTNEAALMQSDGFGPFSEVEKKLGYSIPGASFSRAAGFRSGVEKNEETGESNMEAVSGDGLGAAAESGHGDCHLFNKGKSQSGKCEDYATQSNSEDLGAVTQKADDGQFPYAAHHGSSMNPGMEDFLLCRNDIPFPAPSHGGTMATNTLAYWQLLQASAVNYAAYTAALAAAAAAAAAAGWTGPVGDGKEVADSAGLVSDGEAQQAPLGNAHSFSLPSGATTWCPFGGFLPPPGFCPPSGALQQKGRFLGSATDEQVLGYGCLKRPETDNEEGLPESETGDEAETRTPDLNPKLEENKECGESGIRGGYMLVGSSCATKTLGSEVALGCPKSQHQCPEATKMLMNCSTQESDTERLAMEGGISQQDAYSSSSDDCEGGGKKQREGSSSGSNTPASRYHTSEFEAPNESGSRKRDCCTFENSDDTGCGLLEKSYQACHDKKVSVDPPKMRLKHLEKGRKLHQQRESRDSGCDSFKRFRSSAHDVEPRKEVSEEGRKAFEALFTCKLLPQTFSATHMVCKDVSIGTGRECNTTSLSLMENSNEEISIVENPKGTAVAVSGMVASFSGSMLEVAIKPFTVSSSSGFVPYRKPSCMVLSKMNVPSS